VNDRTEELRSLPPAPRPDDVASPEAAVLALYDLISGPAGVERDWVRLRSLFDPRVRFLIGRWLADPHRPCDVVYEWDLDAFVVEGRAFWQAEGFWESQVGARVEKFGNVAHVFSSYESRIGSPSAEPVGRGVNSIQLLRHADRWWIVAVAWDVETPEHRIPARLDGGSRG